MLARVNEDGQLRKAPFGVLADDRLAPAVAAPARTVVLVEGASDQAALETLAARRGRDLAAEGIAVVSMGGATTIRHFLERFGPRGRNLKLAGLCDAAEERYFRRGLQAAEFGADLSRPAMEELGFFVCVLDLEDELIRSLGAAEVEAVIEAQGDLASFRTFQKQPAQQHRRHDLQLRRFLGTRSGRKIHYARILVESLDLTRVPRPLDGLLARV